MRWGKKTCSVLKQRGCATRELFGNRRVDSRKRDKEQMCPFGTETELRSSVDSNCRFSYRKWGQNCVGRSGSSQISWLILVRVQPRRRTVRLERNLQMLRQAASDTRSWPLRPASASVVDAEDLGRRGARGINIPHQRIPHPIPFGPSLPLCSASRFWGTRCT